jgi:DNA-binding MarR family transcriptional regulator
MAVFQYPGPDGVSPLELAQRAHMSKQAMNQLLGTLERAGFLVRRRDPAHGKQRIVHLTARGRRAIRVIRRTVPLAEREMREVVGARRFATMLACLRELAAWR